MILSLFTVLSPLLSFWIWNSSCIWKTDKITQISNLNVTESLIFSSHSISANENGCNFKLLGEKESKKLEMVQTGSILIKICGCPQYLISLITYPANCILAYHLLIHFKIMKHLFWLSSLFPQLNNKHLFSLNSLSPN